jgi:hypothetical protein
MHYGTLKENHLSELKKKIKKINKYTKQYHIKQFQLGEHILIKSGIHCKYGPHSTRAASTSAARLCGVPLTTIAKT